MRVPLDGFSPQVHLAKSPTVTTGRPPSAPSRMSSLGTESAVFATCNLAFLSWPGCVWGPGADFQNATGCSSDFSGGSFVGADMFGADFSNASMENCDFRNADIYQADFTGADLTGSNLGPLGDDGSNLAWSDFSNAILVNCDLTNANLFMSCLIGANLTGAVLTGADLYGVTYDETTIWPAGFDPSSITDPKHAYADYHGQTLTGTDLSGEFLGHANFAGATLTGVTFGQGCMHANFNGATIQGALPAVLSHAGFVGATIDFSYGLTGHGIDDTNLAFVNFTGAKFIWSQETTPPTVIGITDSNLSYASLAELTREGIQLGIGTSVVAYADLTGADLNGVLPDEHPFTMGLSNYAYATLDRVQGGWYSFSCLSHATFRDANLTNSSFNTADLAAANFTGATATDAAFSGDGWQAYRSAATILPKGISGVPFLGADGDTQCVDLSGEVIVAAEVVGSLELSELVGATYSATGADSVIPPVSFYLCNATGIGFQGLTFESFDGSLANFGGQNPFIARAPLAPTEATVRVRRVQRHPHLAQSKAVVAGRTQSPVGS